MNNTNTVEQKNINGEQAYQDKVHKIGRISIVIAFLGTLLFPLVMIFVIKIPIDIAVIATAAASILAIQIPGAVSQFLSYAPLMQPSAMYMMVVTGNFANMKIPSVISAKEAVGLEQADQNEESDVISTVAMATSTIVCEIILIIGVLLMGQLTGLLTNPVLQPAFAYISPAVFGALYMVLVAKTPKLAIIPLIVTLILFFSGMPQSILLIGSLGLSLIVTGFAYKFGWFNKK